MNENSKPSESSYKSITSCLATCEDIAFSLMAAAKDSQQRHLYEKLYESFKYSDKVSADSSLELAILDSIAGFSRVLAAGQYDQLNYEVLERKVNEIISDVDIRNKRLLESKRGAY